MLDHRRQRDVETSGDLRHRQLAVVCEPVKDRAPRRVSQRGKRAIELDIAKVNHMVMYRSARCRRQDGTLHNRVHEATGRIAPPSAGHDHVGLEVDQFGNEVTKSLEPSLGRQEFQMRFLPFNIARAHKTCTNALKACWTGSGPAFSENRGRGEDHADAVDFPRLLRKCSEGPGDHASPSNEMNSRRPFDRLVRPRADASKYQFSTVLAGSATDSLRCGKSTEFEVGSGHLGLFDSVHHGSA